MIALHAMGRAARSRLTISQNLDYEMVLILDFYIQPKQKCRFLKGYSVVAQR